MPTLDLLWAATVTDKDREPMPVFAETRADELPGAAPAVPHRDRLPTRLRAAFHHLLEGFHGHVTR